MSTEDIRLKRLRALEGRGLSFVDCLKVFGVPTADNLEARRAPKNGTGRVRLKSASTPS